MPNETIWVLIADAHGAVVCETRGGESVILLARACRTEEVCRADLAEDMVRMLRHGAEESVYQGIIIIADPKMMVELRARYSQTVSQLLVGEIVSPNPTAELSHLGVGMGDFQPFV